jgi:PAS domain S-box-containing protein
LTIGIVAIAAGALNSTTFDRKASLAFVMPALAPMLLLVFTRGDRVAIIGGLIMIAFMVATYISARRAEIIFVEAERLRLAESERADEARFSAEQAELARSKLAGQYRLLSDAESSLKTYMLVANSITDMVSVIGEDLEYRMVNDTWCNQLGLAREKVINRKTTDVLPSSISSDERRAALSACIAEQRVQLVRSRIKFPDGVTRHIETTYYPYMDTDAAQNVRCVVMVSRDVTQAELARQQLAESAKYLQRTLNATGDAIFATESVAPNVPVRFVNEQMLDMWGIPRDKLTNLTHKDILTYAIPLLVEPEVELQRMAEVVASNAPHESQVRLRDGRVLLRRCIPAPIGQQTLRVWSFRDITALETALAAVKASEVRSRALMDAFPGFITQVDENLVYIYANQRVAQRLGTTSDRMVGCTVREVVGEETEAWLLRHIKRLLAGEQVTYERHHPHADGAVATDQVTLIKGEDWRTGGWTIYAFGIDITAQKQAEAAITSARDAAEFASRAKSDFLSHMSHELRTPMNAILGFGQLLELDHQSEADRQDWGREVVKGGRHLLTLINEVLDLARVESGKMPVTLEPLVVQPIVDDCLMLVRQQASARNIRLLNHTIPVNLGVQADRTRLKQIMLNLLSNAIKYNAIGGTVVITCEPNPADPQCQARISVTDTGGGLTLVQIAKLFQPFERVDTRVEHIEGSGIGLVLTKRLVELLNGQIGVDSPPGQGCSFWVTLPLVVLSEKDT